MIKTRKWLLWVTIVVVLPACKKHATEPDTVKTIVWEQIAGPSGILCFASSGQYLFAGTWAGLHLSTDNGETWTDLGLGGVSALAVKGSNVFASLGAHGVFRSSDYGTNWEPASIGLIIDGNHWVTAFAASEAALFAAVFREGVFISIDEGATWSQTSLDSMEVTALAVIGTRLFAGTLLGALLSEDNGASWNYTTAGLSVRSVVTSGQNLYVGTSNGVYRSPNHGTSWIQTNLDSMMISTLAALEGSVIAGTILDCQYYCYGAGLLLSEDGGGTWISVNTGLLGNTFRAPIGSYPPVLATIVHGGFVLASLDGEIYRGALVLEP